MKRVQTMLDDECLPKRWYNLAADVPLPPAIDPSSHRPVSADDLGVILPQPLAEQELSQERWIEIPAEVRNALALWRPTALRRAVELERALGTPARIYYKDESSSPAGSHKLNTALPQAWYCRQVGARRLTTETGGGQWGTAVAFACSLWHMACRVYMVRLSYAQKPYRRTMMGLWDAEIVPSPSPETAVGRRLLACDPESPGSIGIAISEAMETAGREPDTQYAFGSVMNLAMLHQTVIGQEVQRQMSQWDDRPDVLVGCAGGGSNFAGLVFPYVGERLGGGQIRFIAAEPNACPTLTRGEYRYDYADGACLTPLLKMYTLGHEFLPPRILAGGLRYHGMSPAVSLLMHRGLIEAAAFGQCEAFEAARLFAATQGVVPAMESSYAIRAAIEEAIRCRRQHRSRAIVFVLSGHGLCDLGCYQEALEGQLDEFEYQPQEATHA